MIGKYHVTAVTLLLLVLFIVAACTSQPQTVEVTRVVTDTETIVVEGEAVEVTRIVIEEVEVEVEVAAEEEAAPAAEVADEPSSAAPAATAVANQPGNVSHGYRYIDELSSNFS